MARHVAIFPGPFKIANGGTQSVPYSVNVELQDAIEFVIYAPATLPETVNVQVTYVDNAAAGDASWRILQDETGIDATLATNRATRIKAGGFKSLMLVSQSAVGADRIFQITGVMDLGY